MDSVSPIAIALLSGGFALGGVLLKVLVDAAEASRTRRREDSRRFEDVRLESVVEFLYSYRKSVEEADQLHALAVKLARDPELDDGSIPETNSLPTAVRALERLRLTARTYEVIRSAEALVRSLSSLASVSTSLIERGAVSHDTARFAVIKRLGEELELVYINAARAELGVGVPEGAPPMYPARPLPEGVIELLKEYNPEVAAAVVAPQRRGWFRRK